MSPFPFKFVNLRVKMGLPFDIVSEIICASVRTTFLFGYRLSRNLVNFIFIRITSSGLLQPASIYLWTRKAKERHLPSLSTMRSLQKKHSSVLSTKNRASITVRIASDSFAASAPCVGETAMNTTTSE